MCQGTECCEKLRLSGTRLDSQEWIIKTSSLGILGSPEVDYTNGVTVYIVIIIVM